MDIDKRIQQFMQKEDVRAHVAAILVTVWSLVISVAFVGVPGYWLDEGATVLMIEKPWENFVATLAHMDAVHGTYYLIMRAWSGIFGSDEFSTRIVSAIAVACTSSMLLILGRRTLSFRVGVIAAVVYPAIPAVVWAAGEARSYALSGLAVVLVLLALVEAVERPSELWRWILLVVAIAFTGWLFLFSLLILPSSLFLVKREKWREHWWKIVAGVGTGIALTLPLAILAAGQRGQVSWIQDRGLVNTAKSIIAAQYFGKESGFALFFWLFFATGVALVWTSQHQVRRELFAYATMMVLPTMALALSGPLLDVPMYVTRYLFFTAPALAILVAIVAGLFTTPVTVTLLIAFLVFGSLPSAQSRLDPLSKSSWLFAAQTLSDRAKPGDAMIGFSDHLTVAREIYPDELGPVALLNETVTPEQAATMVIPTRGGPLTDLKVNGDVGRIWYLSDSHSRSSGKSDIDSDLSLLAKHGFAPIWTSEPEGQQFLVIVLLEQHCSHG